MLPIALLLIVASGCGARRSRPAGDLSWKFSRDGISTVILRANGALSAKVEVDPGAQEIVVSAHPALTLLGYHSRDLTGAQAPTAPWAFDFVPVREGATLVLSSRGETAFPRHRFTLDALLIRVPRGVVVRREKQTPQAAIPH
jgi:hypothetical protein